MLTASQQQAIAARGNVLVMAGAGAGKTRTLVERCLARVLDPANPVPLDRILMVTFTEAAASEMRRRIRESLEKEQDAQPGAPRIAEQLALLDAARIGTLHSFCRQLTREHFFELGLDPQAGVIDEAQAQILALETVDAVLERHLAAAPEDSVQQLILEQGGGRESTIRSWVFQLHRHVQSLPDPERWLSEQQEQFRQTEPPDWERWLIDYCIAFRRQWLPFLEAPDQTHLKRCAQALQNLPAAPGRNAVEVCLREIQAADADWPRGEKGKFRKPFELFFKASEFLASLARGADAVPDPLTDDWNWIRQPMLTLLELTREFGKDFRAAKREQGAVDFQDLEQLALELLWNRDTQKPTSLALSWRNRFDLVFVDEYQDINAAQDAILRALSRDGAESNRFLVGDVKQSIYRFRLANPRIFQGYAANWSPATEHAQVISLSDNFRSHEAILNFVNAVFADLMQTAVGGVAYDETARLRFGAPMERPAMAMNEATGEAQGARGEGRGAGGAGIDSRVELRLRLVAREEVVNPAEPENASADGIEPSELTDAEHEARLVAARLRELKAEGFQVWDAPLGRHRPVEWRDMVILVRAPRNKAEVFAKEFARQNLPLEAERGSFFETTEVADLLNLLTLLDNPLQDIPLLAVLHSPLAGLALEELAAIRLALRSGRYWTALQRFHREQASGSASTNPALPALTTACASAWPKVDRFLAQFQRWRIRVRRKPLSYCLEQILAETHYEDGLPAQSRGAARRANVEKLLMLTRQFDPWQRQGLFRFLKYVEVRQRAEVAVEEPSVETGNAVRLMSIHKAKGLEFPVVVLADLGKRFNFEDLKGGLLLDEVCGLCSLVKPPQSSRHYPSLPYWLAVQNQRRENLGEELRLLYVAFTRACDKLILTGTATLRAAEAKWTPAPTSLAPARSLESANCSLDWLGPLVTRLTGQEDWFLHENGHHGLLDWRMINQPMDESDSEDSTPAVHLPDADTIAELARRLSWRYPHTSATAEPAKTTVSEIRRRVAEETDAEAAPLFSVAASSPRIETPSYQVVLMRAADIGSAHHTFLQHVDLAQTSHRSGLETEARRLVTSGVLAETEFEALNFNALFAFWNSAVGRQIRAEASRVQRELAFTARLSAKDLADLRLLAADGLQGDEFVVVQGVADLVVIQPEAIWLLDYKTDLVGPEEMNERIKAYTPQLAVYALALSRIYGCPVTHRWLHFLRLNRTVEIGAAP